MIAAYFTAHMDHSIPNTHHGHHLPPRAHGQPTPGKPLTVPVVVVVIQALANHHHPIIRIPTLLHPTDLLLQVVLAVVVLGDITPLPCGRRCVAMFREGREWKTKKPNNRWNEYGVLRVL